MLSSFVTRTTTIQGYSLLVAGMGAPDDVDARESLLIEARNLVLRSPGDPWGVDLDLARFARRSCPQSVWAVGLSIHVPGVATRCGGVVGDPHQPSVHADGRGRDLGRGLSGAAYPGGPGVVVLGTRVQAEEALQSCRAGDGGVAALQSLADACLGMDVPVAIGVSDGTGGMPSGCAMALEGRWVELRTSPGSDTRIRPVLLHRLIECDDVLPGNVSVDAVGGPNDVPTAGG